MSDIKSIDDLKKAHGIAVAKSEVVPMDKSVIDRLESRIFELEKALSNAHSTIENMRIQKDISSEELICIEQIEILKSKSSERELTLDETKRLDILVKNIRLIREKNPDAIDVPNLELGEDRLVAIARGET